ncbi:prolipoprotein diacylglyceryl transferase family protein [Symbiobacterium thermophilum]|nr:redoxin domain-containing protein [Symbiobacterium thermophilum]
MIGLRRMHATLAAAIWAVLLLGGAFRPGAATPDGPPRPAVGSPAPALELADPTGQTVRLADFRGRAVFLNFWASWCGPCRAEMPEIQRLAESLPDGTAVLTVNLTGREASPSAPLAYLAEHGYSFPVLLDPRDEAGTAFQVASMPTSLFISPEGAVTARVAGPLTYRAMREYLTAAVSGPPSATAGRSLNRWLPESVPLGPAALPTRALLWLAGVLLAAAVAGVPRPVTDARRSAAEAESDPGPSLRARELVLNLAVGGVLGAKLLYVLMDPGAYVRSPALLLAFPYGRLALPGAVAGGLALSLWGLRGVPDSATVWDRALPGLLLGAGVGALASPDPADWALGPALLAAGLLSLGLSRLAGPPGDGAVTALLLGALAVTLADLARPSAGPAGITPVQLLAAVVATLAWIRQRRRTVAP